MAECSGREYYNKSFLDKINMVPIYTWYVTYVWKFQNNCSPDIKLKAYLVWGMNAKEFY